MPAMKTHSGKRENTSWGSGGNFATASPSAMVRPYTARAFTYAEKIEMMKQQNDYDTEFVAKHLHGSLSSNQHQATSVNSNDNDNSTASPGNAGPATSSEMTSQYQQITANQSKMILQQAMANMVQRKSPNQQVASPNSNASSFDKESAQVTNQAQASSSGSRQKKKKASRTSSGETVSLNGSLNAQTPAVKQEKNHSETASRKSSPQNNHSHMNGNTTPAVSTTLQAPQLLNQSNASMFPSTSDYYGQGEWASTAMATLLQQVHQQKQKTPPLSMLPFAGFPLLAAGTPRITTPSDTTQQQMIYEALNNMQMLNQRHQQQNHIQMESANQHAALLQAALHSNAHNKKDEQHFAKIKQNGSNRSSKLKRSRSTKSDMHHQRNGSAESSDSKRHKTSPHNFHPSKNCLTPPLPANSNHQHKLQQQLSLDQQKDKEAARLAENRAFPAQVANGDDLSAKKISSNSAANSKKVALSINGGGVAANKTPEAVDKKASLVLSKGDQLVVVGDVDKASLLSNSEVSFTLNEDFGDFHDKNDQQNKNSEKDLSKKTEMDKLFSKFVQTTVTCKVVEKTRMCRVCGHKVTVASSQLAQGQPELQHQDSDLDREFMKHVMAHSLSDVIKAGL